MVVVVVVVVTMTMTMTINTIRLQTAENRSPLPHKNRM